ncbi:MAG: SirB2 family protein [Pseudomonadota bacterium]
MNYLLIKYIHVLCVILSFSLFILRLRWSFVNASMLEKRWVKVIPHMIDTALLFSAISLVIAGSWALVDHPWILMKIAALLLYIILGSFALKRAKTLSSKITFSALSVAVFAYIVSIANAKEPLWFLM